MTAVLQLTVPGEEKRRVATYEAGSPKTSFGSCPVSSQNVSIFASDFADAARRRCRGVSAAG